MDKLPPKQQVLLLLEQCLQTGIRGRLAEVVKHARNEIERKDEFTDAFYRQASIDVSDPAYPGLVFKVAKHKRRWVFRYTPVGAKSTKQQTLGYFPEMSVAQARAAWHEVKYPHSDVLQEPITTFSVNQLIEHYLIYAQQYRKEWRAERRLLERFLGDRYGHHDVSEVDTKVIGRILAAVEQRALDAGHQGQRAKESALTLLRHLFDVARGKSEYLAQGAPWIDADLANPCEGLSVERQSQSAAPLFAGDVGRYLKALVGLPINEDVKGLLMLQLNLLCPFSWLCKLEWQHIDWRRQCIALPNEQGRLNWLPLSSSALQFLENRKRQQRGTQPWVFSALKHHHKPMPARYPSELLASLKQHLQLPDQFTATQICQFGHSWLEQQGSVLAKTGLPISDAHFQLLDQRQLVAAAEQWHQYLTNLRQSS
ncbi:integrase family protein [Ferrimonas lipolytica]|uniref:Integrase family protein n=1 Tax=Ferrimonas lipolytica TaxID=2724191 RepID=A0A6H1UBT9_9GAMM|nr:integrase family protein [Ferrimonas lipolytica]QIZ76504.1 integrase family protein [Ferrimonas lipolytica]